MKVSYDMAITAFEDVKEIFRKVIEKAYEDRSKIESYNLGRKGINAEKLEQAICNHMCDDHPEWFGITEHEGHVLRNYIQESAYNTGKEYFVLLHKEFPEFMEPENPKFIRDHVNPFRKKIGLPLLPLEFFS